MQLSDELARLFALLSRLTSVNQRGASLGRVEYIVLARLARDGAQRAGDLAQREGLEPSTLSRRISAMEQRGLLVRELDAGDRRAHLVEITAEGRACFLAEQDRRIRLVTDAVQHWPEPDRDRLVRLLHDLNTSLQNRIIQ